ncbi:MAG: hypothetical protein H6Q44_2380, partial [Deltaproteobacteria bacterium]|nr:hypothetical protein [Deltaproteobacteria bacterium]
GIDASAEIMSAGEEKKEALRDSLHLALRRAIGLRVEVELKAHSAKGIEHRGKHE